jgi:uncharacterized coiled-coil protein SlyX
MSNKEVEQAIAGLTDSMHYADMEKLPEWEWLQILSRTITEQEQQIETLSGQLEGYISTNAHGLRVIEQQEQEISSLKEQVAQRDRAIAELREEVRSGNAAIRNYVAREGGML